MGQSTTAKKAAPRDAKPRQLRLALSRFLYRYCNAVERFFNRIKYFRAVATRYENHAENYLALAKLVSVRICLRAFEPVS